MRPRTALLNWAVEAWAGWLGPAVGLAFARSRGVAMRRATIAGTALWLASTGAMAGGPPPGVDFTGTWTNAWYTQLQRPKEFKALIATPEEAEAYEAPRRALNGMMVAKDDVLAQAEAEFNDMGPGLARIRGEIRSSWITEPADGRVPWRDDMKKALRIGEPRIEEYDHVEQRPSDERCLTARGAGAPILNSPDTNLIQVVQTPDHVVIVSEKNHDARIVRLGAAIGPVAPGGWMGASVGRWEGATLVVTTQGFRSGLTRTNGYTVSDKARVTERFMRTGPREITYLFEVEDPSLYTQVWRGEMVFRKEDALMYEFACHEGNYSLPGILAGARQAEQAAAAGAPAAAK